MFFRSDRSFTLASDSGPCSFCEDGPREPTEIESQIVKSPQVVSDTVAVGVNDCEEVGSGGLDERFISDRIVCFASKASRASLLRCRDSVRRHFVHDRLPGSLGHLWIVGGEISTSEIKVERWVSMRFVHRI